MMKERKLVIMMRRLLFFSFFLNAICNAKQKCVGYPDASRGPI